MKFTTLIADLKKFYNLGKLRFAFVLLCGCGAAWLLSASPWADNLNLYVYDYFMAHTDAAQSNDDIVVIGIDDDALRRFPEPLILWHKYLAQIIRGAADGGAKAIALDFIPTVSLEKIAPEMDAELIKALKYSRDMQTPVYLGFKTGQNGMMPHRQFLFFADNIGFLNLYPDIDGKIRKQVLALANMKGRKAYSLARLLVSPNRALTPESQEKPIYIDYRLAMPDVIPYARVYDQSKEGKLALLENAFKNKSVLVGMTSSRLEDIHLAPLKMPGYLNAHLPGVLIHAFTAKTILSTRLIRDVPILSVILFNIIIGLISGLVFQFFSPYKAIGIITALFITVFVSAFAGFKAFWYFPPAAFIFFSYLPAAFVGFYRYGSEHRRFSTLQRFFKSYVNADVMRAILDDPNIVSFNGQQVEATFMFTDIRNFTSISEQLEPQEIVTGLNRYFSEMTKTVIEADGYLCRYIGDGIFAAFGAPNKLPDNGAWAAVSCGVKMLERLEKLNRHELFPGCGLVRIGIGIHTGVAVAGNIGCDEKMDYTFYGDPVNLASRIEGQNKTYKTELLISETAYALIKDKIACRFVALTKVKGREQGIGLYAIDER